MLLLSHESEEAARASAKEIEAMGSAARKILEECVEEQSVIRTKVSKAARQLEDAGFIFIRGDGDLYQEKFELKPSLMGEEALEVLFQEDEAKASAQRPRYST